MPLLQVVTLSALVTAKSAFAYSHSQSTIYKRGAQLLSPIAVVVVGIVGALLGVVLLVYLFMYVPSWYRNWRERRRTAQISKSLHALQLSNSVNASVTVMGDGDMDYIIPKFGGTPLSSNSTFVSRVPSRATTHGTHKQLWASTRASQTTATPPIPFASTPEAKSASIPSISVTHV